jgi:hypothetical protein
MKMKPEKLKTKGDDKETFRIPRESSRILTELTARIALDNRVRVTKTDIMAGLLDLLKRSKINTKKVENADDVITQFIKHIKKRE